MEWFRVEVTDQTGQVVAIESEMLAGRDIGEVESKVIRKAIEHLNGFIGAGYVDLTCDVDALNPAPTPRTDSVLHHIAYERLTTPQLLTEITAFARQLERELFAARQAAFSEAVRAKE